MHWLSSVSVPNGGDGLKRRREPWILSAEVVLGGARQLAALPAGR